MATIVCPSCGTENPSTNLFCAKCATSLSALAARANRKTRIFLPPQTEFKRRTHAKVTPHFSIVIPLILVVAAVLIFTFYW